MNSALRRFVALVTLALPVSVVAGSGATWGAAPVSPVPPRVPHAFETATAPLTRAEEDRDESAVVLVVLDGVRWQEVFAGEDHTLARRFGLRAPEWVTASALMPNLHRLIESEGAAIGAPGAGASIAASGPEFISLPGYREIFAGKPDPGCFRNDCAQPPGRTIVDDLIDVGGPEEAAVVSSWPNVARAASSDPSRFVLSSGRRLLAHVDALRSNPTVASLLDRGGRTSSWPGEGDYRPDAFTAGIALGYLEAKRPRFLFVGLGDCDEYAHHGDYRGYLEALRASDAFLGDLQAALQRMGARGRHTTVLVTADHGRAYDFTDHGGRYPESARVWLAAFGEEVGARGVVASVRRHTLSDIAPTVRALLGLRAGEGQPIAELLRR
ncbi:MAG: alkaline phosphatase family protein [Myxococcota bacterium]|nr:alkaline phosphatase family protein [Myxococcota bacterium]